MIPTTPVIVAQAITPLFRHWYRNRRQEHSHRRHADNRARFSREFREFLRYFERRDS